MSNVLNFAFGDGCDSCSPVCAVNPEARSKLTVTLADGSQSSVATGITQAQAVELAKEYAGKPEYRSITIEPA